MDAKTLKILACPVCVTAPSSSATVAAAKAAEAAAASGNAIVAPAKGELKPEGPLETTQTLVCTQCNRRYTIADGLIGLLAEKSAPPK